MKIEINEDFIKVVQGIDGGCGPCIKRFLRNLKPLVSLEAINYLVDNVKIYGQNFDSDEKEEILE